MAPYRAALLLYRFCTDPGFRAALYQVGTEPLTFLPIKRLYPTFLILPENKPLSLVQTAKCTINYIIY